ncbi:hypothetical protein [Nonomuraea sp. KM90]|uniref:hypothetical protein n=1 Tax=Nonomuraea sp. KM90 TaxID=3457428 RepID=UPI003FCE6738
MGPAKATAAAFVGLELNEGASNAWTAPSVSALEELTVLAHPRHRTYPGDPHVTPAGLTHS